MTLVIFIICTLYLWDKTDAYNKISLINLEGAKGGNSNSVARNQILEFNSAGAESFWSGKGQMIYQRQEHAVQLLPNVSRWCPWEPMRVQQDSVNSVFIFILRNWFQIYNLTIEVRNIPILQDIDTKPESNDYTADL